MSVSVIEGDQETVLDAQRIQAAGGQVVQINTGVGCHLDAEMVARGLEGLDPPGGSVVVIENVGNLVCPALFDLGEAARVVLASVTEGADKPMKYPNMFRQAGLVLLNKTDLLPYVDFDVRQYCSDLRRVAPDAMLLQLSATTGDGMQAWYDWLRQRVLPRPRSAPPILRISVKPTEPRRPPHYFSRIFNARTRTDRCILRTRFVKSRLRAGKRRRIRDIKDTKLAALARRVAVSRRSQPVARADYRGLPEADPAVVARHPAVQHHPEAAVTKTCHQPAGQQLVLEHPARQRDGGDPGLLTQRFANVDDRLSNAVVEASRDQARGHLCHKVLCRQGDQVRAAHNQLSS